MMDSMMVWRFGGQLLAMMMMMMTIFGTPTRFAWLVHRSGAFLFLDYFGCHVVVVAVVQDAGAQQVTNRSRTTVTGIR